MFLALFLLLVSPVYVGASFLGSNNCVKLSAPCVCVVDTDE